MGSGDWNDGMDCMGDGGGESVWLGFFALCVFEKAFPLLEARGIETSNARHFCDTLYHGIYENAFFGDRFARAFLADGSVAGTESFGDACRIDGLVQAFSSIAFHLTGRGDKAKISAALDSAWRELYDGESGIFKLFSPPFTHHDPRVGYVSRYPEGVRENGGQYTHAAVWSALSYLWAPCEKKKNHARAMRILECILPEGRRPEVYKTEPYVISADIYSNPDHKGRGGWSFYTGSAGWCTYLLREIEKLGDESE
jgi:cellobiose phosphorylase